MLFFQVSTLKKPNNTFYFYPSPDVILPFFQQACQVEFTFIGKIHHSVELGVGWAKGKKWEWEVPFVLPSILTDPPEACATAFKLYIFISSLKALLRTLLITGSPVFPFSLSPHHFSRDLGWGAGSATKKLRELRMTETYLAWPLFFPTFKWKAVMRVAKSMTPVRVPCGVFEGRHS